MSISAIIVPLLRGMHVATLISLLGTLVFLLVVARSAMTEAPEAGARLRRRLLILARISGGCALATGLAWLLTETAVIAGADDIAATLHALPIVALRTQFGQWLLLRFALLLAALPLLRARPLALILACVLIAGAVAVQPMLGHAGALGGSAGIGMITSEAMHMLAAAAWLGGLLPLFIAVGTLPHKSAATACHSFTPVGLAAVLVLGGTAVAQAMEFIGGLAGLFGTAYGQIALVKLGLFIVLLALAALNRLTLTDRLAAGTSEAARRHMSISIATEAILGALVVITAGFLASQMPGTHQQPVWPFAWRPSLSMWYEPALRNELLFAAFAVGSAVLVAINGLIWRKLRWPAMLLAVIMLALAIPHLDLLFVTSYPTSFFSSPTEFAATAIARGEKLFAANCAACHSPQAHGDAARSPPQPAADLTAEHLWAHSEGDLFWFISNGIEAPNGSKAMPGFAARLSTEARWDLIDYLRAHNAGEGMRAAGRWPHPLPAPQFDAACADGRTVDLDDLRGRVLHIVAVGAEDASAPASSDGAGVTTIYLSRIPAARPEAASCVALEPEAWTAFAILLGVPSEAFAGSQVLVDRDGWLRAAWRPGEPGDWTNPQALAAAVDDITAHPLVAGTFGGHLHHQ